MIKMHQGDEQSFHYIRNDDWTELNDDNNNNRWQIGRLQRIDK